MSGYNARRAPNVSAYLADLNTVPGPQDFQDMPTIDDGFDSSLANLEFFDLDAAAAFPSTHFDQQQHGEHSGVKNDSGPYQFNEFQTFPGTNVTSPSSALPSPPSLQGQYPPQPTHFSPATGDKRKASQAALPSAADLEEQSRMAAEEDKRRRNTAASARFRIKKKQREQALEKQAKEMTDKVSQLEGKVQQLEMENKWLKELITEKSDVKTVEAQLLRKQNSEKTDERSTEKRSDGVGTEETKDEESEE